MAGNVGHEDHQPAIREEHVVVEIAADIGGGTIVLIETIAGKLGGAGRQDSLLQAVGQIEVVLDMPLPRRLLVQPRVVDGDRR